MIPYLDTGFLACLVLVRPGSSAAWDAIQRFPAPYTLTFLHQLQIENLLVRGQTEGNPAEKAASLHSARLWQNYLAEGVFRISTPDWDSALRVAIGWNAQYTKSVPPFLLLLHPALAGSFGATHFLSFDPRSRRVAKAAGLQLLPETI